MSDIVQEKPDSDKREEWQTFERKRKKVESIIVTPNAGYQLLRCY